MGVEVQEAGNRDRQILDEVAGLRRHITELEILVDELREAQAHYLTVLESADDAIFIKDTEGRYVIVNSVFSDRVGMAEKDLVSKTPLDVYPGEVGAKIRADDLEALAGGEVVENEDQFDTPEGQKIFLARKVPIRDSDGKIVGLLGISRDITERKRLEEALQERTQELEQFAYVASHDLQEPLRMVSSFVQLLARRYEGKLDSDADEFIQFAVDGATRMETLINHLLEYSRLGTQGKPPESCDCEQVVAQVETDLTPAIKESSADVTRERLPSVMADRTQLAQLFQNLIGNAIKFRGDRQPKIHISGTRSNGDWLFTVGDNGIGIDSQHTERIFEIFERLHSRRKYSGTGIGLAICKKIVERHGGRIWVESEKGEGARFRFTIPVIPRQVMS